MMGWHDGYGMTGWGWFAMTLGVVMVLGLLVLAGMLLVRASGRPAEGSSPPPPMRSPEQILAERFARGEIEEDEYRQRLATLTGAHAGAGR